MSEPLPPSTRIATATVITPVLNAERLIARTVESIVHQSAVRSGRLALQYLVRDGASSDRTVEIVRGIAGDAADVHSEPDTGVYDALAKGLRAATGDMVSYLNAGDVYAPNALEVAADVLEQGEVDWISGLSVLSNEAGAIINVELPPRRRRRYLRKALLFTPPWFPFSVQQESTFWRRRLQEAVDLGRLAMFRLAGDTYLWKCFSTRARLFSVDAHLGGFTAHAGQLSEDMTSYRAEVAAIQGAPTASDRALALLDIAAWRGLPERVRKRSQRGSLFRYSLQQQRWTRD